MINIELVNKTINECFEERVSYTPDKIALEYEDILFSWKDLDILSDKVAVVFMRKGIVKGSHVGIWSINSPNWIISFFALIKLGAIPILINSCYKERELSWVLKYANIEFLCYGDGYKERIFEDIVNNVASKILKDKKRCIAIGKSDDSSWNGIKYSFSEITENELGYLSDRKKMVTTYDTAVMFFTSGTTKLPKGVVLSHYSIVNNSLEIAINMHWTSKDSMCIAVPLFHCFGITACLLASIHAGCAIHLLKCYRSVDVFEKIHQKRCNVLNGVPSMFLAMMYNKKRPEYDLSSIESGIIAGSHVSPCDYHKICETFNFLHLQPSYGQTESSPCITIADYNDSINIKSNTVGKKINNILIRIYDRNLKKELNTGEIGEIQTKGYHVMKGYYNMSEETNKVITEDGWLCTGDLGYLDELGYLHITGRISEMIIRGGENISPAEIEECIKCYKNIKHVKVIGIETDVLQEEIAACIVPETGVDIDVELLKEFILERLSDYKAPKYILKFDELPYTESGKIMMSELKKQAMFLINNNLKEVVK